PAVRRSAGAALGRFAGGGDRTVEGLPGEHQAAGRFLLRSADLPLDQRCAGTGSGGRRPGRGDRGRRKRFVGGDPVIVCRSQAELEKMRAAGRLVGEVLTELSAMVAPGVTTADLDAMAEKRILAAGA